MNSGMYPNIQQNQHSSATQNQQTQLNSNHAQPQQAFQQAFGQPASMQNQPSTAFGFTSKPQFNTTAPTQSQLKLSDVGAELIDASMKYDSALQQQQLQKIGVLRGSLRNGVQAQSEGQLPRLLNANSSLFSTSTFNDRTQAAKGFSSAAESENSARKLLRKSFLAQQKQRNSETHNITTQAVPTPSYQVKSHLSYRNMFGEVEFLDEVSVPEAFAIEEFIEIRQGFVGLRDLAQCPFLVGQRALVRLFNIRPSGGVQALQQYCRDNGARFVYYDRENGVWEFEVEMA